MGGHQVSGQGPDDDGFDEEGYDESQRAEIVEVMGIGPTDGIILTDIPLDLGGGEDDDDEDDDLPMREGEIGRESALDLDEDDLEEDELQDDLDEDAEGLDEDLDDEDDVALRP